MEHPIRWICIPLRRPVRSRLTTLSEPKGMRLGRFVEADLRRRGFGGRVTCWEVENDWFDGSASPGAVTPCRTILLVECIYTPAVATSAHLLVRSRASTWLVHLGISTLVNLGLGKVTTWSNARRAALSYAQGVSIVMKKDRKREFTETTPFTTAMTGHCLVPPNQSVQTDNPSNRTSLALSRASS